MIRQIAYITLFLLLFSTSNYSQWFQQTSGTSSDLRSIENTENEIVYIAGGSGTLLKSTNGGDVWFSLVSGTSNGLWDIEFINNNIGYCVGVGGTILKTTDGGLTWFPQNSGTTETLYCIFIVDANNLYIGSTFGTILKSIDGGEEWSIQNLGNYGHIVDMHFLNHDIGFACGIGFAIKTTDGGTNWIQMDTGGIQDNWFPSVYFQNPNVGYIISGYGDPYGWSTGQISKTNDGGNNWIQLYAGANFLSDIVFLSENLAFVVGIGGMILKTTNTGSDWLIEDTPTNYFLSDIDFSTPIGGYVDGFAVGQGGMILKREGISSVKQDETFITNYNLSQNYPNPFNPSTTIKYKIPEITFVTIKVYDVLGNEVATLVNEEKLAGSYEIEFQSTMGSRQLASGIYYYQLMAGDYVETKKMILLK